MASNKTTIQYICEKSKDAIAFLNLEGYTAGMATLKRKGIASFRFDIIGKETHFRLAGIATLSV